MAIQKQLLESDFLQERVNTFSGTAHEWVRSRLAD